MQLAKSKARLMAGKVQGIIRSIRKGNMAKLTVEQINGLIRKYILEALDMDEVERIMDDSPYDPDFQEDHTKVLDMVSDLYKLKLATKDKTFIQSTVADLLKAEDIEACRYMFLNVPIGKSFFGSGITTIRPFFLNFQ